MKTIYGLILLIGMLGLSAAQASERQLANTVVCKYHAHDFNKTIEGYGSNLNAARASASEKCFEQRMDHYESQRGSGDLYERGLLFIDSCVNIRCS